MKFTSTKVVLLIIVFLSVTRGDESISSFSLFVSNSMDSKYISEGRNIIDNGGISALNIDGTLGLFHINIWNGIGTISKYNEMQIIVGACFNISKFAISTGITNILFLHDNTYEHEVFGELIYCDLNWIIPSISSVYSIENKGVFSEIILDFLVFPRFDKIQIKPYLLQGIDLGYASEDYLLNNIQYGLVVSYNIIGKLYIDGQISHTIGMWNTDDNKDFKWFGVTLSSTF